MQRTTRWLLVPSMLVATSSLAAQQPPSALAPSAITVSARGEIQAVPDRAYILLSVQTRAAAATVASADNASKQTAVVAALRGLGLTNSQISTQGYSVNPETRNDTGDHAPRVVSYLVSNSIRIEVSDLSLVGKIIDSALSHGANRVSSISFFESNADQLYRSALTAAVANARAQAQVMATAAGGRLGVLVELSSDGGRMPSPLAGNVRMAAFAVAETPILPGQDVVEASVTGKWVFIPNQ